MAGLKHRRVFNGDGKKERYVTLKIKESVADDFRTLAEQTDTEQTRLLLELLTAYKASKEIQDIFTGHI